MISLRKILLSVNGYQISRVQVNAIIESGRIAQKWSNVGRICGCQSISSQPNMYIIFILHEQNYGIKSPKGNNPLKLVILVSQKI